MKHKNKYINTRHSRRLSKWKLPLAVSLLAFACIWKISHWQHSFRANQEEDAWQTQHHHTLDLELPKSTKKDSVAEMAKQHELIDEGIEENEVVDEVVLADLTIPWQSFTIKAGDNLGHYFQQANLNHQAMLEVLALEEASHLKRIYPGQVLKIHSDNQILKNLSFEIDPLTTLVVARQENGKLIATIDEKPIEKRFAYSRSEIRDSFYISGKRAALDDTLIMALANVFAYDIDFAQDIQPNDSFKVLYEEHFVHGEKIGNGSILAAEFTNKGKRYQAVRYTHANGQSSYYTPDGRSLKKAFTRTPVQYTRISSHFNLKRKHPVLHKIRAHRGVDYAAPTGTPVKATGSGKVAFVGKKGGYGNTIILQHGAKYSTLYAHLSRFAKNLKSGQKIKQGQVIGYVGSTGLASGPHLHYEFRINGVHHNPLTVALPNAPEIDPKAKKEFLSNAKELVALMEHHDKIMVASSG